MIDVDAGTPEALWAASERLRSLPPMSWDHLADGPVVVVAPHPDDEVLGVGGTLRVLHDLGRTIRVVVVTAGEASHPGSGAITPEALAVRRAGEEQRALEILGIGATVDRLGIPDGLVAAHEPELTAKLEPLLDGAALVLTTWRHDGHPDHEAVGRATARATRGPLVEYPVWAWNWATPEDLPLAWDRARRVVLPTDVLAAKVTAAAAFRSQVEALGPDPADGPILPDPVLAHHRRAFEVLLT